MLRRSVSRLAPALAAAGVFRSFIAGWALAWRCTVFTCHSRRWPSRRRRRKSDFLCEQHIWSATSVSHFSPPCGQSLPSAWGFEKRPGSARGYRSHPAGVKRQRSISLSSLDTPCDPCAAFRMKVGLHRLKGGSTQVDPCAHANAGGQQLGAIRAQNYRTRALCHLNGVCWPRATWCRPLLAGGCPPDATRASGDPDRQEPATVGKRCATSLLMDYLWACASPGGMKRQPLIGR